MLVIRPHSFNLESYLSHIPLFTLKVKDFTDLIVAHSSFFVSLKAKTHQQTDSQMSKSVLLKNGLPKQMERSGGKRIFSSFEMNAFVHKA